MSIAKPGRTAATRANDLGTRLLRAGRLSEAMAYFDHAIKIMPGWFLPHYNLSQVHLAAGDELASIDHLRRSIACEARFGKAQVDLATLLLAQGMFAEGWRAYDWRFDHGGLVPKRSGYDAPVWDGTPRPGKRLAIWSEQGLGDQLQFSRFAQGAVERGLEVHLQASPPLHQLFAESFDNIHVLANDPDPDAIDLQIPLLSLPRLFEVNESALSGPTPYLRTNREHRPDTLPLLPRTTGVRRVGLVWGSGDRYPGHVARDAAPRDFAPLLGRHNVDIHALQFDATDGDRALCAALGITDLGPWLGDFATTAAIVDRLDLVITVDTAMAHLAGALGKPTWVLLPKQADWRWLRGRDDSPWYPSMRLFRQRRPGDWSPVVADVVAALRRSNHHPMLPRVKAQPPSTPTCRPTQSRR